jgi:hypothetical protein
MKENLKLIGAIALTILFLVLEVSFFAAAITVAGLLVYLFAIGLGFVEGGYYEPNLWYVVSVIWMLLEGCKSQIKDSLKTFKEFKFIINK